MVSFHSKFCEVYVTLLLIKHLLTNFHRCFYHFRLGIYSTAVDLNLTKTASGHESILLGAVYGGIGGGIGSALASPFYMVRLFFTSVLKLVLKLILSLDEDIPTVTIWT